MQSKLSYKIDSFLLSLLTGFIFYSVILKFIKTKAIAIIISALAFVIIFRLSFMANKTLFDNKYIKLCDKKFIENCNFSLSTMKNDQILSLFKQIFENQYKVIQSENALILDDTAIIFFNFLDDKITKRYILETYIKASKVSAREIDIFTTGDTSECLHYSKQLPNISINFFDMADAYALFKKANIYPTPPTNQPIRKPFAGLKNISLTRKKARSFLFASFVLYFLSVFVPFTGYYLFFAFASLVLSIICFCLSEPKTQSKTNYLQTNKKD